MTTIKEPTDTPLRAYLGYGLKRAFNAIQADLNETLRPHGLRMISFSALALIGAHERLRQSKLAELLTIEPPNLVVILDELDRAGLIEKTRAMADRRAYELGLTEKGATVLARARKDVEAHDRRMTRTIDASDREALVRMLEQVERQGSNGDD
jgi:DNA-binding MarR family transcriptional regulator